MSDRKEEHVRMFPKHSGSIQGGAINSVAGRVPTPLPSAFTLVLLWFSKLQRHSLSPAGVRGVCIGDRGGALMPGCE